MTLSSTLCKVIHQINPATKRYSFPFKIFKKREAAVWILGSDGRESARLRLDGDYLVSGFGNDSGGEISLTESGLARAATGRSLLVIRDMDFTQDELTEALRQYESMISKLEKALAGLAQTAKPQRTLAERRLKALRIGEALIREAAQ